MTTIDTVAQPTPADRARETSTDAHHATYWANQALVKRDWSDPLYVDARKALDDVMLHMIQAKWALGRCLGTHAGFLDHVAGDMSEVTATFEYVAERCRQIERSLFQDAPIPEPRRPSLLATRYGTECLFVGDVPIVPSICPIVVLVGSDREMGRQYAQQVLGIYGPFIFAWHAGRPLGDEERRQIAEWTTHLERYTPGVIEFARGWAEGATERGVAMDEAHALAIWTGVRPPVRDARPLAFATADPDDDDQTAAYMSGRSAGKASSGRGDGATKPGRAAEVPSPCSGAMAWGSATRDGGVVMGSTSDHDCTFQATIVAFPDEGHNFIYTPFSANGSIPVIGHFFLGGHPGVNSAGLTYVHHAGANSGEPEDEWGYGVRRGPMTFHVLQHASSARQALDMMLAMPVGDSAGGPQHTAGGLWADREYAFSLEARPGSPDHPAPIVREHTYDPHGNEYDVLFATNNAISPESGHLNAAPKNGKGYDYSLEGGWFTFDEEVIQSGTPGEALRRRMTKNSECRNRYLHRMMVDAAGTIDADYMTMVFRQSGTVPEGNWEDVCKAYNAGGQWDCSAAHRANAFTAVVEPTAPGGARYLGCIGPGSRAVKSRDPGHGYFYYDETAAFWEIQLLDEPAAIVAAALDLAHRRLAAARGALDALGADHPGRPSFESWIAEATGEIAGGTTLDGNDPAALARALRRFTVAQVRAVQVLDAITPPPARPDGLAAARQGGGA